MAIGAGLVEYEFWSDAWAAGKTAFHKPEVHRALKAHASRFLRRAEETVFVPLCGKSVDMLWLAARGHHVIGAEMVEQAVSSFFDTHGLEPESMPHGPGTRLDAGRISVLHGDVFELARVPMPRPVTAIWDRAALVALPPSRRTEYVDGVLRAVAAPGARLLLNVFEYDPAEMSGPPFTVPASVVESLFTGCRLELLETKDGVRFVDRPDRPVSRFDIHTWLVQLPA